MLSLPLGDQSKPKQTKNVNKTAANRTRSLAVDLGGLDNSQTVPNSVTFDECLQKYFELEVLPDSELLTCENCDMKRKVSKQTEIYSLPKILVIHLKRFVFSERHMDFEKIDDIVQIKSMLQIPCKQEMAKGTYKLYGIVHHYGTKSNGHYIS